MGGGGGSGAGAGARRGDLGRRGRRRGSVVGLIGVLDELLPGHNRGLAGPELHREHLPVAGPDERRHNPRIGIAAAATAAAGCIGLLELHGLRWRSDAKLKGERGFARIETWRGLRGMQPVTGDFGFI